MVTGAEMLMTEAFRNSWQRKVVEATRGNQTHLGAIVICALGHMPKHAPRFRGTATITSDGFVICTFQKRDGSWVSGLVCDVADLNKNLRRLTDHCKLSDAERVEFFDKMRQWIATDYRARSTAAKEGRVI